MLSLYLLAAGLCALFSLGRKIGCVREGEESILVGIPKVKRERW